MHTAAAKKKYLISADLRSMVIVATRSLPSRIWLAARSSMCAAALAAAAAAAMLATAGRSPSPVSVGAVNLFIESVMPGAPPLAHPLPLMPVGAVKKGGGGMLLLLLR